MAHLVVWKEVGGPSVPQEIRRLRRMNMDMCRRMGQPVIFRHMWNLDDVAAGKAKKCPCCFDAAYQQVRNDCLACFGVGFVSIATIPLRFWDEFGNTSFTNTGIPASKWGGFDVPNLTWMVEPDVAVDVFRINEQGVMVKTYDAQGVAPWNPKLGDNDLCVNVTVDRTGNNITGETSRFQLKQTQQVTMRGFGHKNESLGQPYQVAQTFMMSHIPDAITYILNSVPTDVDNLT